MVIFLLLLGILFTTLGILGVFHKQFDDWVESNVRSRFEPNRDNRNANRNFNRYWGGIGLAIVGVGLITLYFIAVFA